MENGGHLVLSRRTGEEVMLVLPGGDRIVVEVVSAPGTVRLGFLAPKTVKIWRRELIEENLP
jgi:carbon storage regulator CsrA